jgi:hypothetical protein
MENFPIELENQLWKCIFEEKLIDGKFTHRTQKSALKMHLPKKNLPMENKPIEHKNQPWKCNT